MPRTSHGAFFDARVKLPLTDANGRFEIAGILRNSRVAVYVNKPGYSGVWSDRVTTEKPDDIELPRLRLSPPLENCPAAWWMSRAVPFQTPRSRSTT